MLMAFLAWMGFIGGLVTFCFGSWEIEQWWEKRKK